MTLPRVSDERLANLFNRANHLRRLCEFDKAVEAYEAILGEDNTEAEAHWGVVLSRYGIEYVEDPGSGERIPTCHRVQVESVLRDADYLMALEHAPDAGARTYYQEQGKRIGEIQRDILAVSAQEAPYEVFVCYKESTDGGSRTPDSVLAQEIHQHLTEKGIRVFYARISLEEHVGQKYEPYIYGALTSARVMVVVGTKAEHFNAVWVKNEWSRFLQLRKKDRGKVLIPCYKGMDPYELPEELAELQSQDMGKLGFMQDLVRGVEKVLGRNSAKPVEKAGASTTSSETAGWLKRAWLFLEDGEFASAEEYAERVLDREPETGEAYWVSALAGLRVRRETELAERQQSLVAVGHYQKALRFGTMELKRRLEGFEAEIQKRIDEERRKKEEELKRAEVEAQQRRCQAEETLQRAKAEERERHVSLVVAVREQVANGQLEAAEATLGRLGKKLPGVDYQGAELLVKQAIGERDRVQQGLKAALERLKAAESGSAEVLARLPAFPPIRNLRLCREVRNQAASAMSEAVKYLECIGGPSGEAVRRLLEEVQSLDGGMTQKVLRLDRLVKVLVVVWAVVLTAGGLMFQQHMVRQERERQRLVAEAKAAEERAMAEAKAAEERAMAEAKAAKERAMAEAKAKAKATAEAAEIAMAKMLEFTRPFAAGLGAQVGGVPVRWIPAGRYTMGSPGEEEGRNSDEVRHEVVLTRGFFLAETECTQTQWDVVMESNPSQHQVREDSASTPSVVKMSPELLKRYGLLPSTDALAAKPPEGSTAMFKRYGIPPSTDSHIEGVGDADGSDKKTKMSNSNYSKGADRPVEQVGWAEAVEYCRKLTTKQRAEGILPEGWEWRLPTEAEWEYAARAGSSGPRHGELDEIAWWSNNSGSQTHPVEQKAANGWGLHDMLGNVWEWCSDWYGDYPTGAVTDPTGPSSGSYRVFRGGSWSNDAGVARSAGRSLLDPGRRLNDLGFRPVLSLVR